jgi:FecR-like protein
MKRSFAKTFSGGPIALCSIFLSLGAGGPVASAAPLQQARVSQVIQDVRLLEPQATPRPAVVNDKVTLGRAVRTGVESRAELTFADLTITRLGANTIFSLTAGAREINLTNGTILVQVPAKAAAVKINTASVTVGITGGTALLSTGPPLKFMVLEGVGTIYPKGHPEKAVTVPGGEMIMLTPDGRFTLPQQFDVSLVLATSALIVDFPPLTNLPLILQVANQQLAAQLLAGTTSQPLAKNLIDVIDVVDQSATANPIVLAARGVTPTPTPSTPTPTPSTPTPTPSTPTPTPSTPTPTPSTPTPTPSTPTPTPTITPPPTPTPTPTITPPPTPTPTPTPSKFGPPSVIASPNPYLITSGTVITTDPSITTNGVTDFGKIYRSPTDDGAFTLWAFGSTSAFDTALNLDTQFFADPNHFPIAAFKFQSLSLTGNPTIDLSNGGVTKLALIGVDGITSGPPGGTLTFTGLDLLALATVNGPITLTSDVSFQNLSELAMYARGAGSDLTIDSPISNIGILYLAAEGSIQLTNPGTMSVGGFDATAGNDLTLQVGGSLLLNGAVRLDTIVLPGTTLASGANLTLNVTGDYTNSSATDFSRLRVMNDGAHIGTGGNIAVSIGGNLTTTGPVDDFVVIVQNTSGQIDNGGNISLAVGGNVSVSGALNATLDNTGGTIGTNASITSTSTGALTVQGDATFQILNSDNGTGGSPGQIGGNAIIDVTTGGDLTANSILAFVNNHNGGTIDSGANISFNIGGALTTTGDATFVVSNLNEGPGGGTIGSLASVDINAASVSVGGFFQTFVGANGGGSITGSASNLVSATGNFVVQGPIAVQIEDTGFIQINPIIFIAGGHIGGDATVTLSAQNITTSSTATGVPGTDVMALEASIYTNGQGTIGGNAIVNVLASQNISAPGTVFFTVANGNYMGFGPGTIGGDAQINVSAGSLSTGALFDDIYNYDGGSIGRDAIISLNVANGFTATGNAEFLILNFGGSITRNALIDISAGSISAPLLTAEINNNSGGFIGGSATINLNIGGLSVSSGADFTIDNSNGGTIGGNAAINLGVAGTDVTINNSNGGMIGGNATINVSTANISIGGALDVAIHNTAGNIGGNAIINVATSGDINTAGALSLLLENYNETANPAGHIGGSGNVSLTVGGNLTADSMSVAINNRGGGVIGSGASLNLNIGGALTTFHDGSDFLGNTASLSLAISTRYDDTAGNTAQSFIGGDATLFFHSDSASIGGILSVFLSNRGGTIGGNALVNFNVTHDVTVSGVDIPNVIDAADIELLNDDGPPGGDVVSPFGGTIHGNANLQLSAANLTVPAGSLFVDIRNNNAGVTGPGGTIDSSANLTFNLSGDLMTQANATFQIQNAFTGTSNPGGTSGGTIGQDAILNLQANSISVGGALDTSIRNARNAGDTGGSIGGNAAISLTVLGGISAVSDLQLINNLGGAIGGNAAINVSTANISVGSLVNQINNTGGSIGASTEGGATINMNVSGTATVTNDATLAIYGSDGATFAAINVNGGSYDVTSASGTFLGFIDGDGTITFNNASVHADVLRVGALGTNGVLNIGGSTLSADTTLKLYAGGSNGTINFTADVMLGGNSAKILAANTITIFNNVTVTINGSTPANVYTNNANYALASGGNGTTSGKFAGTGAPTGVQPLSSAPSFGDPQPLSSTTSTTSATASTKTLSTTTSTTSTKISSTTLSSSKTTGTKTAGTTINVSNTSELLSLLDGASVGPDGKATISGSKSTTNLKNLSGMNINGLSRGERRTLIQEIRDDRRDTARVGGKRIL